MSKRSRDEDLESRPATKRLRPNAPDRLSYLSDELLLRTLSFLSVSDLVLCERCAFLRYDSNPETDLEDSLDA